MPDTGILGPMPPKPQPAPLVGVCRVCGCTDQEPCEPEPQRYTLAGPPVRTHGACSWVERDLCSRCHGPRHPTRAQVFELVRIRTRVGPFALSPGVFAGELQVHLKSPWLDGRWVTHRTLRMSRNGRLVRPPAPRR